jgi:hypothetical protein
VALPVLPSALTDWRTWKKSYPETTVINMSRTGREFRNGFYGDLSKFVVGLNQFSKAKAWPFDQLKKQPLVNDEFNGTRVLVYFDSVTNACYIFDRTVGNKKLDFALREKKVVDTQTQSVWDLATGKALSGEMKGQRLIALPAIPSFRKSWMAFHPESDVWKFEER